MIQILPAGLVLLPWLLSMFGPLALTSKGNRAMKAALRERQLGAEPGHAKAGAGLQVQGASSVLEDLHFGVVVHG
jgi:hypothetical protein